MSLVYDTSEFYSDLNVSLGSNYVGYAIEVRAFTLGSMQIIWTGANATTGQLIPQASNDGECWCNLISAVSSKKVDEVNGCQLYEFTSFGYKWLRLKYVANTNTTGVFSALVMLKTKVSHG